MHESIKTLPPFHCKKQVIVRPCLDTRGTSPPHPIHVDYCIPHPCLSMPRNVYTVIHKSYDTSVVPFLMIVDAPP